MSAVPDRDRTWPAVMTPRTLAAYLDCNTQSTLHRRVKVLQEKGGLPQKDRDIGGWLKEEIDSALRRKHGLVDSHADDDGMEWLERIGG